LINKGSRGKKDRGLGNEHPKSGENMIEAIIGDYHVVIDLKNCIILHDCADWSRCILKKGSASTRQVILDSSRLKDLLSLSSRLVNEFVIIHSRIILKQRKGKKLVGSHREIASQCAY